MSLAIGSIANRSHFPALRVLVESLRRHHPEIPTFYLAADAGDRGALTDGPTAEISLEEVEIPDRQRFCFRHTAAEVTIALKPRLLRALLDRGFTSAVFLDADILVTGDLGPFLRRLRERPITLSPHRLGLGDVDGELRILCAGVYNGGVVGVSASAEADRFLDWFAERLAPACQVAPEQGLHGDQRWLDLAPGFFPGCAIDRDPGINVAYWNLDERPVRTTGAGAGLTFEAGGAPGRLVHYSGYEPDRPQQVTRYRPGLRVSDLGEAAPLFHAYERLLLDAGWGQPVPPRQLDFFANGVAIPAVARRIFGALGAEAERFGDPFATATPDCFFDWLNEGSPTRLWRAVHSERIDLWSAFPEPCAGDRQAFERWTRQFGMIEYGFDPAFST
jgi:hypothetical protein